MADLVKEARAALEGVTPGPWRHVPNGAKTSITDEDYDRLFIASGTCAPFYDARFIAASRALVPAMADENERLRAALVEIARLTRFPPHVAGLHADGIARRALGEDFQ